MDAPRIVAREEWLEARKAHLKNEKALLRMHDLVMEERRRLPWVRIDKDYRFRSTAGEKSLADLFDGRGQLIVYHFMFAPGTKKVCEGCSFVADHIDGANLHLPHADTRLVVVSRAPLAELLAYRERMGWKFEWVSSFGSDFNYDFGVSFTPEQVASGRKLYNYGTLEAPQEEHGQSAFIRGEDGAIFHTFSGYARGTDPLVGALQWLDLTAKGRNEKTTMDWVRRHDEYDDVQPARACHVEPAEA